MSFRRRGLLFGTLAIASGCGRPQSVAQLIGGLRSPEAGTRRRAAHRLQLSHGIPAEAIEPLLQAIAVERDKKAHGTMLITLAKSGVPEAKGHIDGTLPVPDKDVRRWASKALRHWLIANGRLHPSHELPDHWPYGLPGYPPPLPSQR